MNVETWVVLWGALGAGIMIAIVLAFIVPICMSVYFCVRVYNKLNRDADEQRKELREIYNNYEKELREEYMNFLSRVSVSNLSSFPHVAGMIADIKTICYEEMAKSLSWSRARVNIEKQIK